MVSVKEFKSNLVFAWQFARGQKKRLILYFLCNLIHVVISVIVPIFSAKVIVYLTDNLLIQVVAVSFVLCLVSCADGLAFYLSSYFAQRIYRETFVEIQSNLGAEILKLQNKCIDENSTGVFIQRLTGDTSKIADIFNVLHNYLSNILADIGIFFAVFIISPIAFVALLLMVLCIGYFENIRARKFNEKDKGFREKKERVSGFVGELVRGVRDIKMLSAEKSFMRELRGRVVDLNQYRYDMIATSRNYRLLIGTLRNLFNFLMICLLVYLIFIDKLVIASALVIHNYMGRVTSIVNFYSMLLDSVKDFNLSAKRIFGIMNSDEFPKEIFGTKHLEKVKGNFEFCDVDFGYGDTPVLRHINFKVNARETVAFVGKSGSGKSTIFSLLCKMYEIQSGKIMIDGVDIQELDRASIRDNITIINQNPYIFNVSIRDNLRLVREDITQEEIEEACHAACLDELIQVLPDGYDTIVGEGGITLSGGQRQRLAIARALVQKTRIILFDEATSALDNETQSKIQQAIEHMQGDYTILIIAHRLSTVIHADRILFLNDGVIEDSGTHQELLKKNANYKRLYEAEMKE